MKKVYFMLAMAMGLVTSFSSTCDAETFTISPQRRKVTISGPGGTSVACPKATVHACDITITINDAGTIISIAVAGISIDPNPYTGGGETDPGVIAAAVEEDLDVEPGIPEMP